jgi:hypothetical protein
LKQFFEGRSVTVRIDMPATEQGVDIRRQALGDEEECGSHGEGADGVA